MDNNLLLGILWSWSWLALRPIDAVNFKVILKIVVCKLERRSPFKRYQRRKETQFKISSAQSLATADEKEVRRENVVLCDDNKNN